MSHGHEEESKYYGIKSPYPHQPPLSHVMSYPDENECALMDWQFSGPWENFEIRGDGLKYCELNSVPEAVRSFALHGMRTGTFSVECAFADKKWQVVPNVRGQAKPQVEFLLDGKTMIVDKNYTGDVQHRVGQVENHNHFADLEGDKAGVLVYNSWRPKKAEEELAINAHDRCILTFQDVNQNVPARSDRHQFWFEDDKKKGQLLYHQFTTPPPAECVITIVARRPAKWRMLAKPKLLPPKKEVPVDEPLYIPSRWEDAQYAVMRIRKKKVMPHEIEAAKAEEEAKEAEKQKKKDEKQAKIDVAQGKKL